MKNHCEVKQTCFNFYSGITTSRGWERLIVWEVCSWFLDIKGKKKKSIYSGPPASTLPYSANSLVQSLNGLYVDLLKRSQYFHHHHFSTLSFYSTGDIIKTDIQRYANYRWNTLHINTEYTKVKKSEKKLRHEVDTLKMYVSLLYKSARLNAKEYWSFLHFFIPKGNLSGIFSTWIKIGSEPLKDA